MWALKSSATKLYLVVSGAARRVHHQHEFHWSISSGLAPRLALAREVRSRGRFSTCGIENLWRGLGLGAGPGLVRMERMEVERGGHWRVRGAFGHGVHGFETTRSGAVLARGIA